MANKKNAYKELYLFPEVEYKKEQITDEQLLVDSHLRAIDIVSNMDDSSARSLLEEMQLTEHKGQEAYYLKNLRGELIDVMLFTAIEDCLYVRLYPSRDKRITVPFAYEEAARRIKGRSLIPLGESLETGTLIHDEEDKLTEQVKLVSPFQ